MQSLQARTLCALICHRGACAILVRGRTREPEAPVGAQGQGTALFRAAGNGHVETSRLLLEKGAAVDARKEVAAVP